jgi:hypothetical protein
VTEPLAAEGAALVRHRQRRRPWATAATAVLLVVGVATWWFTWSASLLSPGAGSFGITVPADGDEVTWSFGSVTVCLEGVDSAVVESVHAASGAASVTDFAVRPAPQPGPDGVRMFFGAEPRRLASTEFGSNRTVRGRCDDDLHTELAVELTRPEGETADADGLLVTWSAGLRSGTLRVPGRFVLCDAATTAVPECQS